MQEDGKNSSQVRRTVALSCNLTVAILGYNYVKGIRVTKIVEKITFEGVLSELEPKK